MFWTDWGSRPAIMRARMDGTYKSTVVSTGLRWPNGISLDVPNERLYWVDAWYDKLETSDINGIIRTTVHIRTIHHPFDVNFAGGHLYWTDWFRHSTYRKRASNDPRGNNSQVLLLGADHDSRPFGFTVVDTMAPRAGGESDCLSVRQTILLFLSLISCTCEFKTVEPVYNGHPRAHKKWQWLF